ncbi:MAG: hypothetical protein OEU26_20975 [Candidatus Tectomicrobia bacterium]|nr:hypothetical protein [Candidatus Tectomicrobia bacterium]
MSVFSPVMQRHEVQASTATTRLPDSPATGDDEQSDRWLWEDSESAPASLTVSFDDDQPQQSICEGREPSTASPIGNSYKVDYVMMAAVFAIIVFLWMQ